MVSGSCQGYTTGCVGGGKGAGELGTERRDLVPTDDISKYLFTKNWIQKAVMVNGSYQGYTAGCVVRWEGGRGDRLES